MTKPETFDAIALRKVPYLRKVLPALLVLLILFEIIGTATIFPSERHPYQPDRFPEAFKMMLLFGGFALIPVWILFAYVRLKTQVTVLFDADRIELSGDNYKKVIPIHTLRRVECYDPQTAAGFAEEEFMIVLYARNNKNTILRLKNYADAERVTDILSVYEELSPQVLAYRKTVLV